MANNPPKGVPQIYPRLAYRDPTEAVAWLQRAFGLREREGARLGTQDGKISLAEMELGAGLVMIGTAGAHDLESPAALGGRTQMVIVYVDDVDGHYARAKQAGARIVISGASPLARLGPPNARAAASSGSRNSGRCLEAESRR